MRKLTLTGRSSGGTLWPENKMYLRKIMRTDFPWIFPSA